jgi:hypothetical protein
VVVEPNGAGKSALWTALSILTLSHFSGESSLDDNFTAGRDSHAFWEHTDRSWPKEFVFMSRLRTDNDNDNAPALYSGPVTSRATMTP